MVFQGLKFRDAAITYLEPHGVPSAGDWALEKLAVILVKGSESLNIE